MNRCRGSTLLSKRCRRNLPSGQYYCPTHINQEQYILIFDNKDDDIEKRFKIISKTKRLPELPKDHFIPKQMAARDKFIAFIFDGQEFVATQFWQKLKNPGWINNNNKYIKNNLTAIIYTV